MGNLIPRSIKMERERKRLEALAQQRGYDSLAVMLHDLYVQKEMGLYEIQRTLFTPMYSLRKLFDEFKIEVKPRGGRNNVRIELTPELIQEVSRDGIATVAARLGCDYETLNVRLKKWLEGRRNDPVGKGNDTV